MDRMIYTAMTGATALVNRQQAIAHNLANVSTNGFRAELSTYRSVPVQGEGASTRVMALEATAGHLETPGTLNSTKPKALSAPPVRWGRVWQWPSGWRWPSDCCANNSGQRRAITGPG